MAELIIEKLDRDVLAQEFDCGNSSINRQVTESYFPTLLQYAYAYKVSMFGTVVGYYMIKLRTIKIEDAPADISEYVCGFIEDCSSIHIKYIAVDKRYQHEKIGTTVLKVIITQVLNLCNILPITLITLNALKEKYEWYKDKGFIAFDEAELNDSQPVIRMYMGCIIDKKAVKDYCSNI